ncbi:hypothetical protein [Paractinoplanes rishiriensis]|uniref:Uncharacterized protein n=1 Tax=Paractinoplanes rishiriensis TaxID=1050105 RepID=A0A919JSJ4_9ACTN|nr:hypothetical protein [Actinoplanes rishiriensis]GIE94381.1 hypothetical protein Ari01nite_18460 [Actinoplanes rishiriensis]
MNREPLIAEYHEMLRARGIEHLVRPEGTAEPEAHITTQLMARMVAEARRSAADYGEENLMPAQIADAPVDRLAEVSGRIEQALAGLGHELPGPVYVGEYPHHSFNARALAARNGTLLLINTGLHYLLVEVALALNTRVVVATPAEGGYTLQPTTEAMLRRRREADATMARSLAAYVLHSDSRRGGKQPVDATARGILSYRYAAAAETFAVAHEYGHFLAGHLLARPAGDGWLRKSHDQEFEADEIGMLLALAATGDDGFDKNITVAGTFLFFAIDHLLNRVRDEVPELDRAAIVADHPPSAVRAATLRRTLTEIEGPDVFQLADATTPVLASAEDAIIHSLRALL